MSPTVAEGVLKISALMALAALATGLMGRRASAASRHLVWMLALAGTLALPVVSLIVPAWRIPIRATTTREAAGLPTPATPLAFTPSSTTEPASDPRQYPAAPPLPWMDLLLAVYAAAAIVLLLRLASGHHKTRRLVARAADVTDPRWLSLLRACAADLGVRRAVRLVRTREHTMPSACGLRRSIIVLPAIADTWDEARRRAVLLHELAHVGRFDCLTQTLAEMAVALYWAHPATWWIARRLRIERELACDDRVLAAGAEPAEYAAQLLELAYTLGSSHRPMLVVSMADPRHLEGRLAAVLDPARNRAMPRGMVRIAALAGALIVMTGLAAARPFQATDQAPTTPADASPDAARNAGREGSPARFVELSPGTWEIRRGAMPGRVDLRLRGDHGSVSRDIDAAAFAGFAGASVTEPRGLSTFTLKREAGVFTFEGVLRGNAGGGMFSFTPSTAFADALMRRGFTRPTPGEMQTLALNDVGIAFLEELTRQGYAKPDLTQLANASWHGVNIDYVRQMAELGYRLGTVDALARQRDHGVSPSYIRDLRAQGVTRLSADDLVRARDHGVSPEYVRDLRQLGYGPLTLEQLVAARDHGISPDYARELRQLGFGFLTLDRLTAARDHGISPEYVRGLRELGYTALTLEQLVAARDHGVSAEYVRGLADLGYAGMTLDDLVRLRDHGVSPAWLRTVKSRNSAPLSIDDLVRLRDHGVDNLAALLGPQLHAWSMKAFIRSWLDRWLS
jgi:beta-lactamase regulating signal transducer with metallopeptidase domain